MSSSDARQNAESILSESEEGEEEEEEHADETSPGRWEGSEVSAEAINWLYASRRVPPGVECRRPGDEIEPQPRRGEYVVFMSHFQRGFGLPVSDFFAKFLERYGLQPHHLPANAIFHLSCLISLSEGYFGLWPTTDTWHKFYSFRGMSIPGPANKSKARVLQQCGAAAIQPRSGSTLPRIKGLESCRKWQRTFFYVKNRGEENLIGLPAFRIGVPTRRNWTYNPGNKTTELKNMQTRVGYFVSKGFRGADMVGTFISRRVAPLQHRAHKICYMSGLMDPTRTSTFPLDDDELWRRCKAVAQIKIPEWEWGEKPYSRRRPPPSVSFPDSVLTRLCRVFLLSFYL